MRIELSLKAVDLKNVAGLLKGTSDPFAVVTQMSTASGEKPKVLGKTETIHNTLNPSWTQVFEFDYEMGSIMKLIVTILDEETKRDNKPMGSALFDVADLLGARGNRKAVQLRQGGGKIIAHVREAHGKGMIRLKIKANKLKNTEGFGLRNKSDPFFEISRQINSAGGDTWDNVYRSETILNKLDPDWNMATLQLSTLCGGNLDLPIKVTIFDHENSGKHEYMGEFETTVHGLVAACTNGAEDNSKAITVQKRGKAAGVVYILKADVSGTDDLEQRMAAVSVQEKNTNTNNNEVPSTGPTPSFLGYLSGGLELNVVVGIDFTGSNGNPREAGTLHYLDPTGATKNDYEKAISSILSVLSKYDQDQQYPVLGFGAKYNGVVNHCFQCGPHPEAKGIDGVLDAYHQVFRSGLVMSSPTDITHVIHKAAERAADAQKKAEAFGKQAYTILLVVTDGAVTDVKATADCLARVCDSPLSIVIVGVGNADFASMEFLDDANKSTRRDIAQFVEFNRHKESSASLSAATLKEIPDQVVSYFQWREIQPGHPIEVEEGDIVVVEEEEDIDLSLDFQEGDIVVAAGGTREVSW